MGFDVELFDKADREWDLETLYDDLASAKGRRLTPMEKLHLRGLLCGYSPIEIAEKLNKIPRGVESDLSVTIYRYVKSLVGIEGEKLENWRHVAEFLENAGYKGNKKVRLRDIIPDQSTVTITHINYDKSSKNIIFQINLQIPTKSVELEVRSQETSEIDDEEVGNE